MAGNGLTFLWSDGFVTIPPSLRCAPIPARTNGPSPGVASLSWNDRDVCPTRHMRNIAMIARILRRAAVGIAASGLLAPPALLSAAEPAATVAPAMVSDVALGANGTLRGQVVNAAGAAVAGVNITVRQQETVIAKTSSGPDGKFEVVGLPGGIFQITTDQSEASVRLWATGNGATWRSPVGPRRSRSSRRARSIGARQIALTPFGDRRPRRDGSCRSRRRPSDRRRP